MDHHYRRAVMLTPVDSNSSKKIPTISKKRALPGEFEEEDVNPKKSCARRDWYSNTASAVIDVSSMPYGSPYLAFPYDWPRVYPSTQHTTDPFMGLIPALNYEKEYEGDDELSSEEEFSDDDTSTNETISEATVFDEAVSDHDTSDISFSESDEIICDDEMYDSLSSDSDDANFPNDTEDIIPQAVFSQNSTAAQVAKVEQLKAEIVRLRAVIEERVGA